MTIGGFSFEPSTSVSSGELAGGQGEAVHQSKSGVVLGQVQEPLPHLLLNFPEVSRLAYEGSPMYLYQPGEEVPIMLTKVPEKGLVLTVPQILSHYFQSQHLSGGEGRGSLVLGAQPVGSAGRHRLHRGGRGAHRVPGRGSDSPQRALWWTAHPVPALPIGAGQKALGGTPGGAGTGGGVGRALRPAVAAFARYLRSPGRRSGAGPGPGRDKSAGRPSGGKGFGKGS